jgi:hypothetical protein
MTCADRLPIFAGALLALLGGACEGDYREQPGSTTAVLKFCNNRPGAGNRPSDLVLEIGNPGVRITARSGTCAPVVGDGCIAIQTGQAVPISLREEGRQLTSQLLEVREGEEWVLIAYADAPILDGGELIADMPCASFDWKNLQQ